jgi:predicted GIY-YIG superfamily endonuclease
VFTVYILRCSDGSLYIGQTQDLEDRVRQHQDGVGCVFTASRRPVTVVYTEAVGSRNEAQRRERQIKRWSSAKKEALIDGDARRLHMLSRRRGYAKKPHV